MALGRREAERQEALWVPSGEIVQLLTGELTDPLLFEGVEAVVEVGKHLRHAVVPMPLVRQLLERLTYAIAHRVMPPLFQPNVFAEDIEVVATDRRSRKRIYDLDEGFVD